MNYQDLYWGCDDDIESAEAECPAEAVFAIMEQLYNSGNAINEKAIKSNFAYLCDQLYISKDLLQEPICVAHHNHNT